MTDIQSASHSTDSASAPAGLTAEQARVVAHQRGHARVVAVAGAGKTTTLTHFIGARLSDGVPPRRMLVLMYNRAARVDFERKLAQLLPGQALPEVRTFHSLGLRIYHRLIEQGVLPPFHGKPLSDGECEPVVWRMLQQLADEDTRQDILSQRKKWVEPALGFIDLVKSGLASPAEVFEELDLPPQCRIFVELFDQFEDWRRQQRRISYADMIYDPVMAFVYQPDVAAHFGGHMQWILVDEYQDINAIQQKFLEVLYGGRGSVMVIGDPDQTIYEFRGSRPEFIVSGFRESMGEVNTYQLPHTFRYGHCLSLLANHLITHNKERDDVLCLSHASTPQTRIRLHQARSEAALVLKLIQSEAELEQIAVINRLWALCAPIALGLLQAGVPYQLHNSLSVLDRWELQIFWLLLEIAAGRFQQRSEEQRKDAWLHILTTPYPKVKRQVLESIASQAARAEQDFGEALSAAIPDELSRWQVQQIQARAEIIADAEHINQHAWRLLSNYVEQTDLEDGIADSAFSAQQVEDKTQTIRAFIRFMRESGQSSRDGFDYLQELKTKRLQQTREGQQGVHLTSIHKSKGLEWQVVIIPGLNAHYYPYTPEAEFTTPASDESERRLLYVGMTRARQQLHLVAPDTSQGFGSQIGKAGKSDQSWPSRFQQEMQYERSQAIGQALYQGSDTAEISPTGGALPAWLDQYLQRLQLTLRLVLAKIPERPAGAATAAVTAGAGKVPGARSGSGNHIIERKQHQIATYRIQHETLGNGTVLSEDKTYLKVRFDGDSTDRTLAKAQALNFIRRLS
ncbi:MAG: DNA/RNA helicase [Oceanospirillaceae bacterium]|nr:DNA/RNA helicase [Oceanospirillaceae bacterium]